MKDRVDTSKRLLIRYVNEGDQFINRIIAIDETWLRNYEPELKSQSSERHTLDSPRPTKFRRKQGHLKQLAIIAYDNRGVLSTDFDPVGVTVNGTYYAAFFGDEIESSYTKEATGAPKRWCCAN